MTSDEGSLSFYTYLHRRNDNADVFYIGKGSGGRAWSKANRNKHWKNVVQKAGYSVELLSKWGLESDAFEHEKLLIACGRDLGWALVNATNGGEGPSGWTPSAEARAKMSAAQTGKKASPETRAKRSASLKGRVFSPEHLEKLRAMLAIRNASEKQRAATRASRGRKVSADGRVRMSEGQRGKKLGPPSQEHREKISAALKGRRASDESRAKMSKAKLGKKQPPDAVAARARERVCMFSDASGKMQTAEDWAKELGISVEAFRHRSSRGQFSNAGRVKLLKPELFGLAAA